MLLHRRATQAPRGDHYQTVIWAAAGLNLPPGMVSYTLISFSKTWRMSPRLDACRIDEYSHNRRLKVPEANVLSRRSFIRPTAAGKKGYPQQATPGAWEILCSAKLGEVREFRTRRQRGASGGAGRVGRDT